METSDGPPPWPEFDPAPYVVPPPVNSLISNTYESSVKPAVLQLLRDHTDDFLLGFIVVVFPLEGRGEDIEVPLILVSISTEETADKVFDAMKNHQEKTSQLDDFSFCVTQGNMELLTHVFRPSYFPGERAYNNEAHVGMSIGSGSSVGTSGPIFKSKDNGKFYGLTTAHLFKCEQASVVGQRVLQPASEDAAAELEQARREERQSYWRFKASGDENGDFDAVDNYEKSVVKSLLAIDEGIQSESSSALTIGTVKHAKYSRTNFEGRTHFMDYALYEIETREPKVEYSLLVGPSRGLLKQVDWSNAGIKSIGKLSDGVQTVWKRGRSSGTTFGVLSGIPFTIRREGELYEEFCLFSDGRGLEFAEEGDSGSAVVTSNGEVVAILVAQWISYSRSRIFLNKKAKNDLHRHPDVVSNDTPDDLIAEIVALATYRRCFIVEGLDMILADIGRPDLEVLMNWLDGSK